MTVTLAAAAVGVGGLVALAIPAGAGEQPSLPPVSAQELVSSALSARPPAMSGAVTVDNALGLPALPGLPQLGPGESTIRVWSDGGERSRVALPSNNGERALINDGTTLWSWDSSTRTAHKVSKSSAAGTYEAIDPATAARGLLATIQSSSTIDVDGTAKVADRPAYELVLAPAPTERTLLREIRVAIDAETRLPLRLVVLAPGSSNPVLSVGFTDLTVGPQDAGLFQFIPPPGTTVTEGEPPDVGPAASWLDNVKFVGDGWDMVVLTKLPPGVLDGSAYSGSRHVPFNKPGVGDFDPQAMLERIGTPVNGPWGRGTLVSTAVVSAIVTSDGRIAAGAVPQQVLTEALSR
jgi:outer membrane lipoprotein-sorting protein